MTADLPLSIPANQRGHATVERDVERNVAVAKLSEVSGVQIR